MLQIMLQLPFVISVYKMYELVLMSSMFSMCPQVSIFSTLLTKACLVDRMSMYNAYVHAIIAELSLVHNMTLAPA